MKALIIIDLQNDFLPPNGALAVPHGNEVIPIICQWMPKFKYVIATQDWHPPNHISFASRHRKKVGEKIQIDRYEQVLWPDHCIQNTFGAKLSDQLDQNLINQIIQKGTDPNVDSYSAFFDNARIHKTALAESLHRKSIQDLYFVGLATDYCVLYSVLDAIDLGFHATVIQEGCRAVHPQDEKRVLEKMKQMGAKIV